jgi:predicted O-methyltransferase YrrM
MTTDKYALGYMKHIYNPLFSKTAEEISSVLEIGVNQGESILEWRNQFPNAKIYGVDINTTPLTTSTVEGILILESTDAYSTKTVENLRFISPSGYDIIIDDGSHAANHQEFFVAHYLDLLSENGTLIVEDIIYPGVTQTLINKIDPNKYDVSVYDMRSKQLDPTLNERWKSGLDVVVVTKR